MDPLRGNIKRIMQLVDHLVLERDDIIEILDGRIDGVILKHKEESNISEFVSVQTPVTARLDMEDNGKIDTMQNYTRAMAVQMHNAFKQNYDMQSILNVEQLRTKTSKKAKSEVRDYDESVIMIQKLVTQFGLR